MLDIERRVCLFTFGSSRKSSYWGGALIIVQWNPDFMNPQRDKKIGSKNRRVREIGGKIIVFD